MICAAMQCEALENPCPSGGGVDMQTEWIGTPSNDLLGATGSAESDGRKRKGGQ